MIICKLCNKELKNSLALPSHLRYNHSEYTVQTYYDTFYKTENEGKCKTCNKPTTFDTFNNGYRHYCCSKCAQNSEEVRAKVLKAVIKYDDEFKKTGFCIEKPHVYRYDFDYNGNTYHYIGSTIHSQVARAHNNYNNFIPEVIKSYGVKDFLLKFCTIVEWFDDIKEMTDYEEKLNIQIKKEYGEEFVLSIGNGRKPSKNCINAAIEKQRKNGSWNKGKKLSNKHRLNISNGMSNFNIRRGKEQMIECLNTYIQDQSDEKLNYRIKRYIKTHYDKTFILSINSANKYLNIIKTELNNL